jgi:phage N-6-adenine-methyltransferase
MSDLWATPQELFRKLDKEFNFTLDVCANFDNHKCAGYYTPELDGLSMNWVAHGHKSIWMNPPYGREIQKWMKKAHEASLHGTVVVALIPNRSNAPWWHDYVMKAAEIRFIKHKVAFDVPNPEQDKGVPFWGSVIVVFSPVPSYVAPRVSSYLQPKHEPNNR